MTNDDEYKPSRGRRKEKTEEERRQDHLDQMQYAEPGQPKYERKLKVMRDNLIGLVRMTGKPAKEVAGEIGVDWRWFQRLLKQGLARIDSRFRPSLRQIATFFDLEGGDVDELWNPKLPALRRPAPAPEELASWRQKRDWPYAKKLLELLETGQHDHLRSLIDSLYRLAAQEGLATSKAGYTTEAEPADPFELKQRRASRQK